MSTRIPCGVAQASVLRQFSTTSRCYAKIQYPTIIQDEGLGDNSKRPKDKSSKVRSIIENGNWLKLGPEVVVRHGVQYRRLEPPAYPYGESRHYKQSNKGLYGGLTVRVGNNVSHKTKTKTRRTWYPNIVRKKLYSVALEQYIELKVATRVLRTIDKAGGLDEYLLGDKTARIKELGLFGWKLRWTIMHTPSVRMRLGEKAKAMGVDDSVRFERGWMSKDEITEYRKRMLEHQTSGETSRVAAISENADILAVDGAATTSSEAEIKMRTGTRDEAEKVSKEIENKNFWAAKMSNDIEESTEPAILQFHNLSGRLGRRTQKYEPAVLLKLADQTGDQHQGMVQASEARPGNHGEREATKDAGTKDIDPSEGLKEGLEEGPKEGLEEGPKGLEEGLKERLKEGPKEGLEEGLNEGGLQDRKLETRTADAAAADDTPYVTEQPVPVPFKPTVDTRTMGQKFKDLFSRLRKEHAFRR